MTTETPVRRRRGAFPIFITSHQVLETNWIGQFEAASIDINEPWALICTQDKSVLQEDAKNGSSYLVGTDKTTFIGKDYDYVWSFYRKHLQPSRGTFSLEVFGVVDEECIKGDEFRCRILLKVVGLEELHRQTYPVRDALRGMRYFENNPEAAISQAPEWKKALQTPEGHSCPMEKECELRQAFLPVFSVTDSTSDEYLKAFDEIAKEAHLPYRLIWTNDGDSIRDLLHTSKGNAIGDDRNAFKGWYNSEGGEELKSIYRFFRDYIRPDIHAWLRGHFTTFTFAVIHDSDLEGEEKQICVLTSAPDLYDNLNEGPFRSLLKNKHVPLKEAIDGLKQLEAFKTTFYEWDKGREETVVWSTYIQAAPPYESMNVWGQGPSSEARYVRFMDIMTAIREGKFKSDGITITDHGTDEQAGDGGDQT